MEKLINIIKQMTNNKISNYVLAGLESSMVGGNDHGCVRLFSMEREQHDVITPHSHRFNLTCLVLAGSVTNIIWHESPEKKVYTDLFMVSKLQYLGNVGEHKVTEQVAHEFYSEETKYNEGDVYAMKADDIHSIKFSKNALVLVFEGVNLKTSSIMIEPMVNGLHIPTYKKKSYMFLKD